MEPYIIWSEGMKLVGKRLTMSFKHYKISELWQSFMPNCSQVVGSLTDNLISMTVYSPGHFTNFSPDNEFEKWASIEVDDFKNIPDGMETYFLPAGLYAVFHYKGLSTDTSVFQYIFNAWLPQSGYMLDDRPHFEVLGNKYRNNDPDSEEDIWIPIKEKT